MAYLTGMTVDLVRWYSGGGDNNDGDGDDDDGYEYDDDYDSDDDYDYDYDCDYDYDYDDDYDETAAAADDDDDGSEHCYAMAAGFGRPIWSTLQLWNKLRVLHHGSQVSNSDCYIGALKDIKDTLIPFRPKQGLAILSLNHKPQAVTRKALFLKPEP